MKYGLFGIGSGLCAEPGIATRVAQAAEAAGFDSVWTGEHVVLPDPREAPSPAPPDMPMLHPSTILAYLAGVTRSIKLGTGIVLIAQRNPVVLAKEIASLDVVCGGRLLFGVGAGYLHQEFKALGVNFKQRGARTDEYIQVLRTLWTAEKPAFSGKYTSFENIQAFPRPVQAGGPPIIIGGASQAALQRTLQYADGWYGFALDVAQTRTVIEQLRELFSAAGREWTIDITVTPRAPVTPALRDEFAAIGVDRLLPMMPQESERQILDYVGSLADQLDIARG